MEKAFEKATVYVQEKLADPGLAHLTDEQRDTVLKKHEACANFFNKVKEDRAAKANHQDPAFKLKDIEAQLKTMQNETNAIFMTKPPKKESPAKPAEDAKMADESKENGEAPAQPEGPEVPPEKNEEMKPEEASEKK